MRLPELPEDDLFFRVTDTEVRLMREKKASPWFRTDVRVTRNFRDVVEKQMREERDTRSNRWGRVVKSTLYYIPEHRLTAVCEEWAEEGDDQFVTKESVPDLHNMP